MQTKLETREHRIQGYTFISWYDADGNFLKRMDCKSALKIYEDCKLLGDEYVSRMIRDITKSVDIKPWR